MNSISKSILLSVFGAFCLLSTPVTNAQQNAYASIHALDELEIIRQAILAYHPCPFRYISKESWHQKFEQTKSAIKAKDSIDTYEFIALSSPLISLLRDEHTNLYPIGEELEQWNLTKKYFPFRVSIAEDNSLEINRLIEDYLDSTYVGKKIISINGRSSNEIIEVLKLCGGTSSSSDYSGTLYHAFNFDNFSRLYHLCVDQAEEFDVQFASGEKVKFAGFCQEQDLNSVYRLVGESRPELHFSDDPTFAYLKVSTFWPMAYFSNIGKAQKETDKLFKQLKRLGTTKLVIDISGNRGGTPFFSTYLAGYFFEQPFQPFSAITAKRKAVEDFPKQFKGIRKPDFSSNSEDVTLPKLQKAFNIKHQEDLIFKGEVIILIDAGTGSAATIFGSLMREVEGTKFWGDETLGDANHTTGGQFQTFNLPHAKSELTIPLIMFHHGRDEHTYGIKPDARKND